MQYKLGKLGIKKLNEMQEATIAAIETHPEVILHSPTGTGKTIAFLLPILKMVDVSFHEVQVLIIAPSRELVQQIETVIRNLGTGLKVNAVYGGQNFSKDRMHLKHTPTILLGTPGRIADHLRRDTLSFKYVKALVLDEFDKSLEVGFEKEMKFILNQVIKCKRKILTSATNATPIPDFVLSGKPKVLDYSAEKESLLQLKKIVSEEKDKLETLGKAICHFGEQLGIVFCNFKDSIQRVSEHLSEAQIAHGTYHGGMEQVDRERALIKFRNGTHRLLLATDLAARGLDIPEVTFIIHYHLPHREEEFIHRNGRTARMHSEGAAYVLAWKEELLPEFIPELEEEIIQEKPAPQKPEWKTLFISGGRKDKISKGDIAGLFIKQGSIKSEDLGIIELKSDCAFVGVSADKSTQLISTLDNTRLKKKKVRIREI